MLADIMRAVDTDDSDPVRGSPDHHYQAARTAAAQKGEVSGRTDIRKLLYSPTLPWTLGTIMRLGPPFSTSRFLNLTFLKDLQRIHAGVSSPDI